MNDIQMVGLKIQNKLVITLLRFRLHRFDLTADIVKMYRLILIIEKHRRFQYILWRSSPRKNIQTFQHNTVTYFLFVVYITSRISIYRNSSLGQMSSSHHSTSTICCLRLNFWWRNGISTTNVLELNTLTRI